MELMLYDYHGNFKGFTDRVISGMFSPNFCGFGTSEYHISMSSPIVKTIMTEPFLIISESGHRSLVIGHTASDAPGGDFAIYGRTLSWLCEKTLVKPVEYTQKTVAEIVTDVIADKLCGIPFAPTDGSVLTDFTEPQNYSSGNYTTFEHFLQTVLKPLGIGYTVDIAGEKAALTLTVSGDTGKYISVSDGNAAGVTREYDILDRSVAGFRLDKDGVYQKVGSDDSDGLKNWYGVLDAETDTPNSAPCDKLQAKIQRMKYETDYKLGDIFTVQFETEKHLINYKRRISGVTINDDINGHSETPTFEEV